MTNPNWKPKCEAELFKSPRGPWASSVFSWQVFSAGGTDETEGQPDDHDYMYIPDDFPHQRDLGATPPILGDAETTCYGHTTCYSGIHGACDAPRLADGEVRHYVRPEEAVHSESVITHL